MKQPDAGNPHQATDQQVVIYQLLKEKCCPNVIPRIP
jgi:hypothetical protein